MKNYSIISTQESKPQDESFVQEIHASRYQGNSQKSPSPSVRKFQFKQQDVLISTPRVQKSSVKLSRVSPVSSSHPPIIVKVPPTDDRTDQLLKEIHEDLQSKIT